MAVDVGSAVGYLDLDITKFLASLKQAQEESERTSKGIVSKLDGVGSRLTSVGAKTTALVTTPILGAGTAITKTTGKFESAMSKVSAISGAAGKDLENLTGKAKEMGEKTKFSASESAEAFQYMAMAGWKTEEMLNGIEGIMNLAAADGLDLATTSDIVTDALTAFGLSAKDSGHFADVLAAASTNANTNVSMLGESFKYIAPLAGTLGYSIEDVASTLGLMANAGIKGSQAGTSLRTSITRMIKPTEDAQKIMDKLGISMTNDDGTMKTLSEIVETLREKMGNLSEEEQSQAAAILFGQEAMSGMLAVINAAPKDYDKLTNAIDNSNGKAKEMADIMNDNLNGQITLLMSQIEGVAIKLGSILLPVIKKIIDKISQWIDWFANLSESTQETIIKIAAIAAAIGPVILAIGKIIQVVSTFIKIAKTVKTVMVTLNAVLAANPILLIVAAIAALVAAFVYLWNNCEEFRNFWINLWEEIQKVAKKYIDAISDFITSAWEVIKVVWDVASDFFISIWSTISEALKPLINEMIDAFRMAWEAIQIIWDYAQPYFEAIWNGIKIIYSTVATTLGAFFKLAWEAIKAVWDIVVPYFNLIWQSIKAIFSVVAKYIGGFFSTAWEAIKAVWDVAVKYFTMVWAGIKAVFAVVKAVLHGDFSEAWEAIKNVWDKVKDYFEAIWNGIKAVFGSVIDWFSSVFSAAWEGIKNVWDAVGDYFSGVWSAIKRVFSGVGEYFKTMFKQAIDNIKAVFSGIGDYFAGVWNNIINLFGNVGTQIGDAFSGAFKSVVNSVFEWIENRLNDAIGMINGAIDFINEIPGVNVGSVDYLSLPRLAKGGLAYGPTAAIVGDNKNALADPEVISPLSKLKGLISESFVGVAAALIKAQNDMINQVVRTVKIVDITPLTLLMEELITVQKATKDYIINQGTSSVSLSNKSIEENSSVPRSGDTYYVFNSPKVIDEEEAANQIKRVQRDILEGF